MNEHVPDWEHQPPWGTGAAWPSGSRVSDRIVWRLQQRRGPVVSVSSRLCGGTVRLLRPPSRSSRFSRRLQRDRILPQPEPRATAPLSSAELVTPLGTQRSAAGLPGSGPPEGGRGPGLVLYWKHLLLCPPELLSAPDWLLVFWWMWETEVSSLIKCFLPALSQMDVWLRHHEFGKPKMRHIRVDVLMGSLEPSGPRPDPHGPVKAPSEPSLVWFWCSRSRAGFTLCLMAGLLDLK